LILATARVYLRNPKTVVAALCADHLISNRGVFLQKLEAAAEAAAGEEAIVTFGIPPTYAATGYGYIQISRRQAQTFRGERFFPVRRFKEKPGLEQAREFVADGRHFWNSGMFIWRADVFGRKLERYAPEFYPYWERILRGLEQKDDRAVRAVFKEIPALSIDYALMERAEGILMNRGDFGWSDVGSWSSLAEIWTKDKASNALHGDSLIIDSSGCLLYNPGKLTALVGLEDVIIVDTKDALLVCRRDQDQRVKDIIEELKKKNARKYL
jgi:mannose-1-phosphate guanylyltransferase